MSEFNLGEIRLDRRHPNHIINHQRFLENNPFWGLYTKRVMRPTALPWSSSETPG
jgi:hypothetical protein